MPASSTRRAIVEAMRTRVERVRIANGFETNAGAAVFLGELPALGPDDPAQAIAIIIGDEDFRWMLQGQVYMIKLPISLVAMARADLDEAWIMVEQVIADIKRAVELEDRTLDGLLAWPLERGAVRTLPRDPGTSTVATDVRYTAVYKEGWGRP